jgi:predicted ArsR family transcriptional regulator
VDRLPLLKALADDSRYAIFVEMSRASGELSTTELAERLDLHPNTVRLHLERLRDVGLVEASTVGHGSVGRPQHHWAVTAQAPSLGLEPGAFRVLAHLLAEAAAAAKPDAAALQGIGQRAGEARSGTAPVGAGRAGTDGIRGGPAVTGVGAACLRTVIEELADLGFDPVIDMSGGEPGTSSRHAVAFTSCPFRELATAFPDLVCALHRGVTEGIVAAVGARTPGVAAEVSSFRAELAITTAD